MWIHSIQGLRFIASHAPVAPMTRTGVRSHHELNIGMVGVHEPDVRMKRRGHHPAGCFPVALRDRDRGLVVQTEDHLRRAVAEIVDDAVVQAPVARAGIECDVGQVEVAQHRGDGIAAVNKIARGVGTGASWMIVVSFMAGWLVDRWLVDWFARWLVGSSPAIQPTSERVT